MMNKYGFLFILLISLFGCRDEVETGVFEEVPQPDPIPVWGDELFLSATIDGNSRNWTNDGQSGNGIDSAWYTVCADTSLERLKGQSAIFGAFNEVDSLIYNTIEIELLDCAPFWQMDIIEDSVIQLGAYDYGSSLDTIPGVIVSFADDTGLVWSTQYPLDTFFVQPLTSYFVIEDLLENKDGFSAFTMAGKMECVLYDTNGNSMLLTNGQFISRIGRDY